MSKGCRLLVGPLQQIHASVSCLLCVCVCVCGFLPMTVVIVVSVVGRSLE